jgi:hypothetical protein
VPAIERRQLRLSEALDDREDGGIDKPDPEILVLPHELSNPYVVRSEEVLDLVRAAADVVEEGGKCAGADEIAEVIDLDQDGRGDDAALAGVPQQRCARTVGLVAAVERRDKRPRIDYERDGRGSKSPSTDRRARSPRPERPTPIE